MKNPDEKGRYDCPKASGRKKFPNDSKDYACAKCIREYYNIPPNKNFRPEDSA